MPDTVNVIDCDLIGVEVTLDPAGDISVPIPEPGTFVTIELFADPGVIDVDSFTIGVAPDGSADLQDVDDKVDPRPPTPIPACDDSAKTYMDGGPMPSGETFKIYTNQIPNYLDLANTIDAIKAGMNAWPNLFNNCGYSDNVTASTSYGGSTTAGTSVSPQAECNYQSDSYNSVSVIGFNDLPAGYYGNTCRYGLYYPDGTFHATAGDIRLNVNRTWTNVPQAPSCSGATYDVQSVVTHEAGHWWGLDHVAYPEHANLTMTGGVGSNFKCSNWMRSLGYGDVRGMRLLYP